MAKHKDNGALPRGSAPAGDSSSEAAQVPSGVPVKPKVSGCGDCRRRKLHSFNWLDDIPGPTCRSKAAIWWLWRPSPATI